MSLPTSQIFICSNVKLSSDYIHSIYFPDINAQNEYFSGKVAHTFSDYTYLRKSWNIKVNATMAQARKWSYLYFINDTKRWYYFIKNIEYVNDNCVELWLEMDVIQTYMFDWGLSRCFVEREHVRDDTIGKHLIEEGLDTGEFLVKNQNEIDLGRLCVIILSTINPNTGFKLLGATYHGVFSGVGLYAVHPDNFTSLGGLLNNLDVDGKSDAIISMWMYPIDLVSLEDNSSWLSADICRPVKTVNRLNSEQYKVWTPELPHGYKVHNNKLHCYPYNFLYVSNNMGDSAIYKYEFFNNREDVQLQIEGAMSPDAKVFLYPKCYKGEVDNYEEGLTLSGFPTCAWNQDIYKLYVAQNTNQINLSALSSVVKLAGGVGTAIATAGTGVGALAGVGVAVGGLYDMLSIMARNQDMSIQPPQAKGTHSASVNTAMGVHTFITRNMCITEEYARAIDGFFDIYGYAVKTVKIPSLKNRENWTYIKTVGCHITGDFCVDDKNKIQRIFDNGITFWVDGDKLGNYQLDNSPIGES